MLEQQLASLLVGNRPLFVSFSGGRDSSALLALAAHVSRRHGLPLPIPLIQRFKHPCTAADEDYQSLVLAHLGLEAIIVRAPDADDEVLGPPTLEGISEAGLSWPWRLHTLGVIAKAAAGGVLVDGEGGDDVFGPTPVRVLHHLRQARRFPKDLVRRVAQDLGPDPVRRWLAGKPLPEMSFFTPVGRREVWQLSAQQFVLRPRAAGAAIRAFAESRALQVGHSALDAYYTRRGVQRVSPLLSLPFVDALAGEAGTWGWRDRSTAMGRIFSDVLPAPVLNRTDKVDFTDVVWGEKSRAWLASWNRRAGVNPRWIDADELAAHWAGLHPLPGTALMAQAAWLEQELGRSLFA